MRGTGKGAIRGYTRGSVRELRGIFGPVRDLQRFGAQGLGASGLELMGRQDGGLTGYLTQRPLV